MFSQRTKYRSLHLYCYNSTQSFLMDMYGYSVKRKARGENKKSKNATYGGTLFFFFKNVSLYIHLCSFYALLVGKEHRGIKNA